MLRCIHIGLLCVQENAADRPTMASVVLMLSSSSLSLAAPSEPAFFMHSNIDESTAMLKLDGASHSASVSLPVPPSENDASVTELHAR